MKLQFVLSEKNHINSFIYCLRTLHGNFVEVLFNFNKNGLSLSQFWEDKNTDRGKYFFFFDTSFFSKITGAQQQNVFFKLNLKDIIQKLRSHKRDTEEIYITVTNQKKDGEIDEGWYLVEFMISLDHYGSVIYRNACEAERASKDFSPLVYYQHIHNEKQLFFVVEPSKLDFLQSFKNDFVELFFKNEMIDFIEPTNNQKYSVKSITCFKNYHLGDFLNVFRGVNTLTNPPHHLQRYSEICTRSNRDMAIYVNKKTTDDGSIKFYCPVKSESFVFMLKFKMKISESRPVSSNSFPTVVANRVVSALDTSMSNHMHPNSSNIIPAIRSSMEIEGKMSYQEAPTPHEFPNSNSSPNFFVSNPMKDQPSSNATKVRKRNEFQLSQEHDYKKSKLNNSRFEEEETSPISIILDRKPLPEFGSRSNSFSNGYSEIKATKETPNNGLMRTIKQEHVLREPQRVSYEEYEYRKKIEQQRSYDKNDMRNGRMIMENGRTSTPKYDVRNTAVNSVVEHKRVLFDAGPRKGGFFGKDTGRRMEREILDPMQSHQMNEAFTKKLKDAIDCMKL